MTSPASRFAYLDDPDPFGAVEMPPAPAKPALAAPITAVSTLAPEPSSPPARARRKLKVTDATGDVQREPSVVVEDLDPVAAYDWVQRDQARISGEPTDRMRTSAIIPGVEDEEGQLPPFAYLWNDGVSDRILHTTDDFDGGSPRPVNASVLADLIDGGFRLVMPDDATANRLQRACSSAARDSDQEKADLAARVSHQLAVMSRLSWSAFFVVLTRALARRFWMPLPYSADDARGWAQAFGISREQMNHATMGKLLTLASDGDVKNGYAKDVFYAERSAIKSSAFPGLRASVSAFQSVNRAEAAMSAMTLTDLLLIERHVLTGAVCRLQVTATSPRGFEAIASQPFKLRSGKEHAITAGRANVKGANAVLDTVQADGRTLVATFAARSTGNGAPRRHPVGALAADAMAEGSALFAYEKPFSARPPSSDGEPPAGRWSAGRSVEPVVPRWTVPVEVAMAGAPDRA